MHVGSPPSTSDSPTDIPNPEEVSAQKVKEEIEKLLAQMKVKAEVNIMNR